MQGNVGLYGQQYRLTYRTIIQVYIRDNLIVLYENTGNLTGLHTWQTLGLYTEQRRSICRAIL